MPRKMDDLKDMEEERASDVSIAHCPWRRRREKMICFRWILLYGGGRHLKRIC